MNRKIFVHKTFKPWQKKALVKKAPQIVKTRAVKKAVRKKPQIVRVKLPSQFECFARLRREAFLFAKKMGYTELTTCSSLKIFVMKKNRIVHTLSDGQRINLKPFAVTRTAEGDFSFNLEPPPLPNGKQNENQTPQTPKI